MKSLIYSGTQFSAKDPWHFARSLLEWQGRDRKCGFSSLFGCILQFFLSCRSSCSSVTWAPPASGAWLLNILWISLGYCFPSELFMCCSLVFAVGQMLKIRIHLSNLYGSLQCMWFRCLPSPRALGRFSRPSDCGLCIHCCHKSQDFSFQCWHVKIRHPKFFHREYLEFTVSACSDWALHLLRTPFWLYLFHVLEI